MKNTRSFEDGFGRKWEEDSLEDVELVECSRCHKQTGEDDIAYDADEDEINPAIPSKFTKLCFPCLQKVLGKKP